jgi:hypothetical protein
MAVPEDIVTSLQNCHIMKIEHVLKMEVVSDFKSDKLDAEVPIVLGDIKIRSLTLEPQSEFCALRRYVALS